ncbi:MAG: hypothetical protein QOK07_135, partial [Gemmatimonadaceae bacterium]|nr:hypothetical protein [Gemmatimonadaceae bacterium]
MKPAGSTTLNRVAVAHLKKID